MMGKKKQAREFTSRSNSRGPGASAALLQQIEDQLQLLSERETRLQTRTSRRRVSVRNLKPQDVVKVKQLSDMLGGEEKVEEALRFLKRLV